MTSNADALIVLVLDQSGSMSHTTDATIKGVNVMIEEQSSIPGTAYLTLTLFDTGVLERYTAGDLSTIPAMARNGDNSFQPSGGTALYDAVAQTIRSTEAWLVANPFKGKVIFVIFTDGQENSSKHTTLDQLNDLVRVKKDEGWEFIFMGSGQASWTEGKNLQVAAGSTTNFAPSDTFAAYAGVSHSVAASRTMGGSTTDYLMSNTAHLNADPTMGPVSPGTAKSATHGRVEKPKPKPKESTPEGESKP